MVSFLSSQGTKRDDNKICQIKDKSHIQEEMNVWDCKNQILPLYQAGEIAWQGYQAGNGSLLEACYYKQLYWPGAAKILGFLGVQIKIPKPAYQEVL